MAGEEREDAYADDVRNGRDTIRVPRSRNRDDQRPKDWPIKDYKDTESINYYQSVAKRTDNDPVALDRVMKSIQILGRDQARLPMQWDD